MKGVGAGGMQKLMQQANQMQNKMKKIKEQLAEMEFEGAASGVAVKVKVNGQNEILSVTVAEGVVSGADDVEMLQDLIVVATNAALKTAKEYSDKEMEKVSGGLSMPGLFG